MGDIYHADVSGARAAGVHALLLDPFGDWPEVDCERAEDLSPFVLEAQQVAFVRALWSGRTVFAGADVERSLRDAEWRVFVQIGAVGEVRW